jgi:hypothetical protein
VWWFKPVILALRRRRQEDLKIEDILSYIARLSQKTNTKKKKKKEKMMKKTANILRSRAHLQGKHCQLAIAA